MATPDFDYDFIVIGSGFGGSVSALRLSEKGYRVGILEKGRRFAPQDFAQTNWELPKFVWAPQLGCYGIQVLSFFRHAFILSGAGVGGGSLVYANQLLAPSDQVLQKPQWGRPDWAQAIRPCYERAQKMLGAVLAPKVGRADEFLREIGIEITGEDTFHKNQVGIFFGEPGETAPDPYFNGKGPERVGCTFCGACMVGCRDGGKNTLDKNYLYLAEKLGAEIIPQTMVTGVRPHGGGYEVLTKRTTGLVSPKRVYRAPRVIFSGGVLGSVKLLLKCKAQGMLPALSPHLGNYVRTNSESLPVVTARDKKADFSDQIAITSGIYPDHDTHIEVVRYNKGSDIMGLLTATLLTDGGGNLPRPLRLLGNFLRHPLESLKCFDIRGWGQRTSVLLAMQTVDTHFRLTHRPRWWRLGGKSMNTMLPRGQDQVAAYLPIAHEVARRMARRIGGVAKSPWMEAIFNLSSTAHILGGAVMGRDSDEGVVGFDGQVHGYPGLYVVDGSNIPVNLGVNPSLTIAAVAEHIMEQVPSK